MHIKCEFDRDDGRLLFALVHDDERYHEWSVRLMPDCPGCHGTGGFHGGWYEPAELCGICDGDGIVTPWQYLVYRYWDSKFWGVFASWDWWVDAPTRKFEDKLENERWLSLHSEKDAPHD